MQQIVLEHCRKSSPNLKKKTQTRNQEQMVIRNSFNGKAHFNHPLSRTSLLLMDQEG